MIIKNLADELTKLLELFKELSVCLDQETKELANVNIKAIDAINTRKEELASRIEQQSAALKKRLEETSQSLGLPPESTLGAIAKKLQQRGNREIPRLHEEINKIGDNNSQLLALNREIAENFYTSVGTTLELLTRLVSQSSVYGATGSYQQRQTGSVLVNREA